MHWPNHATFRFTFSKEAVRLYYMKNIVIFPALDKVRKYQLKCSLLLTSVPLLCSAVLTALLLFFSQLNLYFLENSGLIISDAIRQAYHQQVEMELFEVGWFVVALFVLTFIVSFFLMGWAVSPFTNAQKVLRASLKDKKAEQKENDWLSESPVFHRVIWGLAQRLKDKNHPYDKIGEPKYQFNYRFFFKFVLSFYAISTATGYVLGIILNTAYLKIVSMAITLVRMNQKGYYFLAQEQLLRYGVTIMVVVSCTVYAIIGFYITRYMSNMLFVFIRAVKEHHFPLKLRDSDIYHGLADAISDLATEAGLNKK